MFGKNKIVGKTFFKQASQDELYITSRFFTLQGEGPYRGQPAYFIRLAKCNLACSFCDTYFDSGDWVSFTNLLEETNHVIDDFFKQQNLPTPVWAKGSNKKIVLVITGGEPTLQNNLARFLAQAQPHFQKTQIESNGTALISNLPENTTLVISPKCLEKEGKVIHYLKPTTKVLERADCLKFVMAAPDDELYSIYSEIPAWAHEWSEKTNKPVYVSPMNIYQREPKRVMNNQDLQLTISERSDIHETVSFWEPNLLNQKKNQRNHEYAAEYCMKSGFILNLQLHLFAGIP
jgi:7-carboxy-7-deazaguanine synthase